MRLKLCSVAYTCSCAAQKVGLHRAATRSIGTHVSNVMHAGWKMCMGCAVTREGRCGVTRNRISRHPRTRD